jgi:hypothetical protein
LLLRKVCREMLSKNLKATKMRKIVITVLVLMCGQAFGLNLMGPPMAELQQGQKGVGFNLYYGEMDLEEKALGLSATIEDADKKSWVEIQMVGEDNEGIPGEKYKITLPDDSVAEGTLDENGFARVEGFEKGT